ncbi:MAG: hypothetical protein JW919_07485 [Candidatus Omnitrophica bacterium]|nr:hypothetical protein [Candidatus Omnitrophota bacterium]
MILYGEILKEFQRQKVRYVLVGGIAFNLLGGERATHDMDILVEMTDGNLKKIVNILVSQGYRVKQPVAPIDIADKKTRADWIKNKHMKAFNFYKEEDLKEVDIIVDSPVQYAGAAKDKVRVKVGEFAVPVISIKKLMKMKRAAGRPVDRLDINVLKEIDRIKRRGR